MASILTLILVQARQVDGTVLDSKDTSLFGGLLWLYQ